MSITHQHDLPRDQFSVPVCCPKCGQTGILVWEENSRGGPLGPQSELISVSAGFYERLAKKAPHAVELVCHKCGAVQPE